MNCDVAVVGLGAMGSATLYHAAVAGARVVGIDRWSPPHSNGSTHGRSRIIREAYFEHPSYVPLLRRAYEQWDALERDCGERLLVRTRGMMIGRPDSELVQGTLESARLHGIPVETLSPAEVAQRFPAYTLEPDSIAILERNAGVLFPERCVRAYLELASKRGADIRLGERVIGLEAGDRGIRIVMETGIVTAGRVVVAAGAWTKELLAGMGETIPLRIERTTMHWAKPENATELGNPGRFPISLIQYDGQRMGYAIPDVGDGIKVAIHHGGTDAEADSLDRIIHDSDRAPARSFLSRFLGGASWRVVDSSACTYTNTPDGHFILDRLPSSPNVIVLSACSGHGFKLASSMGEAAARMALDESIPWDLSLFRLQRFRG